MHSLYDATAAAVKAACVAFATAFPAAAIIADLEAAKLAALAGIAAAVGVGLGAAYAFLAPLWGKVGNWLRLWKQHSQAG